MSELQLWANILLDIKVNAKELPSRYPDGREISWDHIEEGILRGCPTEDELSDLFWMNSYLIGKLGRMAKHRSKYKSKKSKSLKAQF